MDIMDTCTSGGRVNGQTRGKLLQIPCWKSLKLEVTEAYCSAEVNATTEKTRTTALGLSLLWMAAPNLIQHHVVG
jgi:hypothetical protein